jgi:hypothetical protein
MQFLSRLFIVAGFFSITLANAQQSSYYVVIGAFLKEENAQRYTDQALASNIPATYSMSADKKFYYVYVRQSLDRVKAQQTVKSVREEGFSKAWIFQGALENLSSASPIMVADKNKQKTEATPKEGAMTLPVTEKIEEKKVVDVLPQPDLPVQPPAVQESKDAVPAGKPFVFRLLNEVTGAAGDRPVQSIPRVWGQ